MAIAKRFIPETKEDEDPWDADSSMMTWASAILLAVIFLIVLGVSIIWLTVHPRQLKYVVKDAFLSNFTLTDGRLVAADIDISMSAYNPNHRVSFSYGSMKVSVKSDGHTLAFTYGPPLFHDKENWTDFAVNLVSHDVGLPDYTWHKLKAQELSREEIKIDVIIEASVKFKARHWKQDQCTIWIICGEVVAHFSRQKFFKQTPCNVEL